MAIVSVTAYMCERCEYRWLPRKTRVTTKIAGQPKMCPACKSPFWNRPRKISLPKEKMAASREKEI